MTTAEYDQWFILSGIHMLKEKQRRMGQKKRIRRPDKMSEELQRFTNWLIYILPSFRSLIMPAQTRDDF